MVSSFATRRPSLDLCVFRPRCEHLEALLFGPPLQNVDIDISHSPAFHLELGRLVEIDRVRSNKRRSVVVDDEFLMCAHDSETRPKRETRPIRGRAHHVTTGQIHSERIFVSALFDARVSGRADVIHATEMRTSFFDSSDWLVNN